MKTTNATRKARMGARNLRLAAWVMSCVACIFMPNAVHGQTTCTVATVQLQNFAQQVQVVAYRSYYGLLNLQGQCNNYCGYNVYCQQNCLAMYVQPHYVHLSNWYYTQMQQISYWYNTINSVCARRSLDPVTPDILGRGSDEQYDENRRLRRRLKALEQEVDRIQTDAPDSGDDDQREGGNQGGDVIVDIVIPRGPSGIAIPGSLG